MLRRAAARCFSVATGLVVPQGVDQLALVHVRTALDPDLGRALAQLVNGAVLVVLGLPALATDILAARLGVGDPGRLLLALPMLPQLLVELVVLHGRSVVLRHERLLRTGL